MKICFKVPALKYKKYIGYKKLIRECFLKEAKDFDPIERPVSIRIKAIYKLARNTPSCIREEIADNGVDYVPISKPYLDNVANLVFDALKGVAYIDKKQVHRLTCDRFFDTTSDIDYLEIEVGEFHYKTLNDLKSWSK